MEYKNLGLSDLQISRIGFGGMSLDPGADSEKVLLDAFDAGINYFDTADIYQQGVNESLIGRVFSGLREKVILATKVGNQWKADGSGLDWIPTKKYILSAVEKSLERLQTDYIDLYQLHGGTLEDPIDEIIEAFELLKTQGKIRYYGISSIRPNVIREYVRRSNMVSVMMQYSLLDRRPEEEMLDLLLAHGIGVLARGTVASGLLISKPPRSYLNHSEFQIEKIRDLLRELENLHRTAESIAIQYVLNHPAITSAIVGIRTAEQLRKLLEIISSEPILPTELAVLREEIPAFVYELHR